MSILAKIFHRKSCKTLEYFEEDQSDKKFVKFARKVYWNIIENARKDTEYLYNIIRYEMGQRRCILVAKQNTVQYQGKDVDVVNVIAKFLRWPDLHLTEELLPSVACTHAVECNWKKSKQICINPIHLVRKTEEYTRILSMINNPTGDHALLLKNYVYNVIPGTTMDWIRVHYYEDRVKIMSMKAKQHSIVIDNLKKKNKSPGRMSLRCSKNPARGVNTVFLLRTIYTGVSLQNSAEGIFVVNSTPKNIRVYFDAGKCMGSETSWVVKPNEQTILFWTPALMEFLVNAIENKTKMPDADTFSTFYITLDAREPLIKNGLVTNSISWLKCDLLFLKDWILDGRIT